MSEGPTIGDWTQYEWIPDDALSFPASVRLRNPAWLVYYEPDTVVQRERAERLELQAENAKLRELVRDMWHDGMCECDERGACAECEYHFPDRMRELGIEVSDG